MISKSYKNICFIIIIIFFLFQNATAENVLRPDYQNNLLSQPGVNSEKTSSAIFFGGGVFNETSDLKPGTEDKSICLPQYSFGQMLSNNVPYVDYVNSNLNDALKLLYDESDNKPAAFRYIRFLYSKDEGEEYIRARFESLYEYWGDAERARAFQAAAMIKKVLKYSPSNKELRWQLLDIYYNMAVADMQLAKQLMIDSILSSIGYKKNPSISKPYSISHEIAYLEVALKLYDKAAVGYYELFNSPMGFNVSDIDSELSNMPFGHYIFRKEVPNRSLESPLVVDTENNNELVAPGDKDPENPQRYEPFEVIDSYKDLVLLFDIQKEYLRCAAELTRKYILRNAAANGDEKSDKDKALELIGKMEQKSYIEGNILLGICPDYKNASEISGLAESINGWRNGITQIASLKDYVDGEVNLLGFTDDFLTLVQSIIPGDNTSQYFDSYNFFENYLISQNGPLAEAKKDLDEAKNNYITYRDRQDQLAIQYIEKKEAYNLRLFQIMGAHPNESAYETPLDNVGCEVYQQKLNIELAKKRIEKNANEIENLIKEIQIEVERRGAEKGINNAINSVYMKYASKQASLTESIAKIQAFQALSSALAAAANSSKWWGAAANAAHGVAMYVCEINKGQLQIQKDNLAAQQNVEINSLNDILLDINSKTRIKTMMLRVTSLSIDSQEAAIELSIQQGRLFALHKEKIDIERRIAESNENLSKRFFADPSHRLIMDSSVLKTKYSFKNAQKWMFYAVKALEYKWNRKFEHEIGDKQYSSSKLLSLRNADELMDMYTVMKDWNTSVSADKRNDDGYKNFSMYKDFYGFSNFYEFTQYINAPENKTTFFLDPYDADNPMQGYKVLKLTFSTNYETSSGFFAATRWLEKINTIRIKVIGGQLISDTVVAGFLKYGTMSFIRNKDQGTLDPDRPDRLINEMKSYPSKYWSENNLQWEMTDRFGSSVNMMLSPNPEVEPNYTEINVFKEYSIASTGWELYIPIERNGKQIVDPRSIRDIEVHFRYYWYSRRIQ